MEQPTVLLTRGCVLTPDHPAATSILTVGDQVAELGDTAFADRVADPADLVVDLEGRLVTPGFVDAHAHVAKTGFALQSVDLTAARTMSQALDLLAAGAAVHPGVFFAHGWDDSAWPEGRCFTGAELERAVGARPAYVSRVDAHSAVVTRDLVAREPRIESAAGWHRDGRVERDAHHLARTACDDLRTEDDRRAALLTALRAAAQAGIISLHDLNAPHISPFDDLLLLADVLAARDLPEVVSYWGAPNGGEHADERAVAGFAGDLCIDGSLGSRTAALLAPYADADTSGHLYLEADAIARHVVWCTRRGHQAGFHVIGDAALAALEEGLLAAVEEVGAEALIACRHRVEHVEMPSPTLVALLARLGIVASVQPAFDAAWGQRGGMYEMRVGKALAESMNPWASMRRAGVVLAFGSDSPVTPFDPWGAIVAARQHHGVDERLSVPAAFEAHTRGGHRARHDDVSGVLTAGSAATYAVWNSPASDDERDLDANAWTAVAAMPGGASSLRTVVGGFVVHDNEELAVASARPVGVWS